jgi:hypothetical protein
VSAPAGRWHARRIGRRAALTALGAAPVLALQPRCATSASADLRLATIRRLLDAVSSGTLEDYLENMGSARPVVSGLSDDRGASLLPRLRGASFPLAAGRYLVREASARIDVLLPDAEPRTAGQVGMAGFFFADSVGEPELQSVMFAPERSDGLSLPVVSPEFSAAEVQQVYDRLVAAGGGTLFFPAGTYRISLTLTSRSVRLAGAGMEATILRPATAERPVIEGAYASGTWSPVEIADLAIVGDGKGDGFRAGHVPRAARDEFVGRTRFRNVRFADLGTCIDRPYGQIGLWLENCVFQGADYHLHSIGTLTPGEAMHSGNVLAQDCHFSGARKAVFLLKSGVTGTGQITFDRCIMELNEGFVFYVDTMNGVEGVPGMLIRSCWNEANASKASVDVDQPVRPIYGYFRNASLIRFEDTPLGDLDLIGTTIETIDCSLDRLRNVRTDASSTLVHRHARGFGSFAPKGLVESVAASYQFGPNRALSFVMPIPRRQPGPTRYQSAMLVTQQLADGSARVALGPGQRQRLLPPGWVAPDRWLAWSCECRRVAGAPATLSVSGQSGISAPVPIDHDQFRSIAGMARCDERVDDIQVEAVADVGAASVIELRRVQLVSFARRQDALDYLNSGALLAG